jgi:small neutral amino acid transporter SnatA (MarC family)
VFRIVGGMIIAYMGFDMLRGQHTVGQATVLYRLLQSILALQHKIAGRKSGTCRMRCIVPLSAPA